MAFLNTLRITISNGLIGIQTLLTATQLFDQYGTELGDMLRFDFGSGSRITVFGVADLAELGNTLLILQRHAPCDPRPHPEAGLGKPPASRIRRGKETETGL